MRFNKSEGPAGKKAIEEGEINRQSRKDESNTCEEAQSFSKNIEGPSFIKGASYQRRLKPTNSVIWRVKEAVVGLVASSCKSGKKEVTPAAPRQAETSSRVEERCDDGAMSRVANAQPYSDKVEGSTSAPTRVVNTQMKTTEAAGSFCSFSDKVKGSMDAQTRVVTAQRKTVEVAKTARPSSDKVEESMGAPTWVANGLMLRR